MSYDDMVSCLCHILVSHGAISCHGENHAMVKIDGINNQAMLNC